MDWNNLTIVGDIFCVNASSLKQSATQFIIMSRVRVSISGIAAKSSVGASVFCFFRSGETPVEPSVCLRFPFGMLVSLLMKLV